MTKEKIDYIMNLIEEYGNWEWEAAKDDDWESYKREEADEKKGKEVLKKIREILLSED